MSKLNNFILQFGTDKFMHFMVGAAGYAITESWIVLGILAFCKELYDKYFGSGWSNKDAFATILGGVCACIGKLIWSSLPYVDRII